VVCLALICYYTAIALQHFLGIARFSPTVMLFVSAVLTFKRLGISFAVVGRDLEFKSPQLQSILMILSMLLKVCNYYKFHDRRMQ
jgi:hypothetical protein